MYLRRLINHKNKILKYCVDHGVPVILLYDPKSKKPSVSLTLVFISFNIWLLSIVGVTSTLLGDIDKNQAFNMVLACFGLYYGRKLVIDGKKVTLGESDEKQRIPEDLPGIVHAAGREAEKISKESCSQNCSCKAKKPVKKRD